MIWEPLVPWPVAVLMAGALIGVAAAGLVRARRRGDGAAGDGQLRMDGRGGGLGWGLRLGAAIAAALILFGPAVSGGNAATAARDVDVWFVVDRTNSMIARDYEGSQPRLDGVRADVGAIIRELPGARYSLISFDSSARTEVPLTTDASALESRVETLRPENRLSSRGSSISEAAAEVRSALERAEQRDSSRARFVFYLGDGEQTAAGEPAPFDVGGLVTGGAVLGYGSEAGGPMQDRVFGDEPGNDISVGGEIAVSRIDEGRLRTVAEQLGVPYVHRDGGAIAPALAEADPGSLSKGGLAPGTASATWVLALVVVALLGFDVVRLAGDITVARGAREVAS